MFSNLNNVGVRCPYSWIFMMLFESCYPRTILPSRSRSASLSPSCRRCSSRSYSRVAPAPSFRRRTTERRTWPRPRRSTRPPGAAPSTRRNPPIARAHRILRWRRATVTIPCGRRATRSRHRRSAVIVSRVSQKRTWTRFCLRRPSAADDLRPSSLRSPLNGRRFWAGAARRLSTEAWVPASYSCSSTIPTCLGWETNAPSPCQRHP